MHAWQWFAHLLNATIKSIECNKRNMIASWFYFVGIPGMLSQFLDSLSLVFPCLLWATVQASDFGSLSICQHVPKKTPWTQLQVLFWSSFNSLVASSCKIFRTTPLNFELLLRLLQLVVRINFQRSSEPESGVKPSVHCPRTWLWEPQTPTEFEPF